MAVYSHLPLKRIEGELRKKKNGGFPGGPKPSPSVHGKKIKDEIGTTQNSFKELPAIGGVDPSLILKIKLDANISEDDWRKLGLSILTIDPDKTTVLFADDASLQSFHQRVDAYRKGAPVGQKSAPHEQLFSSIESVSLVEPVDRIGSALKRHGYGSPESFDEDVHYTFDFELHKPSTDFDAKLFVFRFEQLLKINNGNLINVYFGQTLILIRADVTGKAIRDLLDMPELAIMDLPPSPDIEQNDLALVDAPDVTPGPQLGEDVVTIGIVDSGVNFGHKLLQAIEAGAFTVSDTFGPEDEGGHGTSVASIAAFGDIEARVFNNDFDSRVFRIASARVTEADGSFPVNLLVPELMEESIRRLNETYGCRIINISLGDKHRVYDGGRVDPWSAPLDRLSRELDVLIIVSAGNRGNLTATYSDGILKAYPRMLLDEDSRLIPPAIGANVISVGSIAHSNGISEEDAEIVGIQPVCDKEEPSPFTRCGPGVRDMVKPDFVDFGGTAVWDGPTQRLVNGNFKAAAGIWACHHQPLEQLFRSRSGTSFSSPQLAYKAAVLLEEIPNASANLLKALLGISAQMPVAAKQRSNGLTDRELMIPYGYGLTNPEHAAQSDDSRVVLYQEDILALDHFAVYEIPIPKEFQNEKGDREIKVSLAFDPPTRHTRSDYLGTTMGWRLIRGSTAQEVFDRFRKWETDEEEAPDFESKFVCKTPDLGPARRDKCTLQTATFSAKTNISAYGDQYYLAVWCSKRWSVKDVDAQRFAVAVQMRHENVSNLYQRVKNSIRVTT